MEARAEDDGTRAADAVPARAQESQVKTSTSPDTPPPTDMQLPTEPVPDAEPAPDVVPDPEPESSSESGFLGRLFGRSE